MSPSPEGAKCNSLGQRPRNPIAPPDFSLEPCRGAMRPKGQRPAGSDCAPTGLEWFFSLRSRPGAMPQAIAFRPFRAGFDARGLPAVRGGVRCGFPNRRRSIRRNRATSKSASEGLAARVPRWRVGLVRERHRTLDAWRRRSAAGAWLIFVPFGSETRMAVATPPIAVARTCEAARMSVSETWGQTQFRQSGRGSENQCLSISVATRTLSMPISSNSAAGLRS